MRPSAPPLLPLFRPETELAILGAIFVGPQRRWTISLLADHLGISVSSVGRKIGRLERADVLRIVPAGRNKIVSANWDLPWAPELASLLDKTIGRSGTTPIPTRSWAVSQETRTGRVVCVLSATTMTQNIVCEPCSRARRPGVHEVHVRS